MVMNISLSDDDWDGRFSLFHQDEIKRSMLRSRYKSIKEANFSFQIDFKQPIDLKDEHSRFRNYQESTKNNLSLLSDKDLAQDMSPVARRSEPNNEDGKPVVSNEPPQPSMVEDVHANYFRQAMVTCQVYRVLMVMSDYLVCLSHGSNDVANAISPLIVLMDIEDEPVWISFLVGAAGIALGLLIFGERVMKTIGEDLIKLDYMKGFCTQFSTAICVCVGSNLGIPLSTTHCIVGSLAGVHLAGKTRFMKTAYNKEDEVDATKIQRDSSIVPGKEEKKEKDESSKMNFGTVKKILTWWGITLPTAFLFSAFLTWIFLKIK